ncbi:MAG: UDP-N-acetylglucosamine--N-acetylmuramyl-(pentapeptide) pyrophosphoryl-undecaprenol N-acetylglucosamine transferase [Patescibacteria group bacterium]
MAHQAKILITGGHLTPALAFIDHIQALRANFSIVFLGRLLTREFDEQPSQEKFEVEKRSVPFVSFKAPKLSGQSVWQLPITAISVLKATVQAAKLIRSEKPDVIVSFGSYLAVPAALAAWLLNIPVITHEQTRTAGFSNQLISRLARTVAISHPESKKFFPKHKTVVTGNLLRKQLSDQATKPSWFTSQASAAILYITGGSQGSEVINSTVCQVLPRILRDWRVIHQCGASSKYHRYRDELLSARSQLQRSYQDRYFVQEWLTESELAWVYQNTALAISRAGANTTQELALHRIPAILIPLANSHRNEQEENAKMLAKTGGAIIIRQNEFTPEKLLEELKKLGSKYKASSKKLGSIHFRTDAPQKLLKIVEKYLPAHAQTQKKNSK